MLFRVLLVRRRFSLALTRDCNWLSELRSTKGEMVDESPSLKLEDEVNFAQESVGSSAPDRELDAGSRRVTLIALEGYTATVSFKVVGLELSRESGNE